MTDVPLWRLYLLRAAYLILAVGLGLTVWPKILSGAPPANLAQGVVRALLGALSLLSVLGLRYPLRMLPLLFFEFVWKAIWLSAVALPAWTSGRMDADTLQTTYECLPIVVVLLMIPWRYVVSTYITGRGDRWA
jgi:hypothetical protein